ncbi:hypothetical protein [Cupriavidus sp. YR651]|uniref:hypothetical protein n=1 Tax=Cupriavidus sp. YR651 TaxID=1855315 RepID=UPI00115FE642|nr:hypothetical protein [Cupriavidus sp. YR651]
MTILSVWDVEEKPTTNFGPIAGLQCYLRDHGVIAGMHIEQAKTDAEVGPTMLELRECRWI